MYRGKTAQRMARQRRAAGDAARDGVVTGVERQAAIAYAAGWDAGHRSMAERGLSSWDDEAWRVAARTMLSLLPDPVLAPGSEETS